MDLVRELPASERPREKAEHCGVACLSNQELLAVLIRTGISGTSALAIARQLLQAAGGIGGLNRMDMTELCRIRGVKKVKALELQACFELARRMSYEETRNKDVISDPDSLFRWLQREIGGRLQEHFLAVYLNTQNCIITYRTLFIGTLNAALVSPREVFREALLLSSAAILLVHNHPSGDLTPSTEDLRLTRRMMEIGRLMEIRVLDHLIVSASGCASLYRAGLMAEDAVAEEA